MKVHCTLSKWARSVYVFVAKAFTAPILTAYFQIDSGPLSLFEASPSWLEDKRNEISRQRPHPQKSQSNASQEDRFSRCDWPVSLWSDAPNPGLLVHPEYVPRSLHQPPHKEHTPSLTTDDIPIGSAYVDSLHVQASSVEKEEAVQKVRVMDNANDKGSQTAGAIDEDNGKKIAKDLAALWEEMCWKIWEKYC